MDFDSKDPYKDPYDYVQGALSFSLWVKLFKRSEGEDLFEEFREALDRDPEVRETLQARSRELLHNLQAKLLVKEIRQEIASLLEEKKKERIFATISQLVVFGTSVSLLTFFSGEMPVGAKILMFLNAIGAFAGAIISASPWRWWK